MTFWKNAWIASSSPSSELRRAISSLCSSPWTTCCVVKVMSSRFLPSVPDRVRFSRPRIFSFSSWVITPSGWSNWDTISRFSFT